MFHYFRIPYFTCTFFTKFIYNEYIGPYFLSHVVLRFSPSELPKLAIYHFNIGVRLRGIIWGSHILCAIKVLFSYHLCSLLQSSGCFKNFKLLWQILWQIYRPNFVWQIRFYYDKFYANKFYITMIFFRRSFFTFSQLK